MKFIKIQTASCPTDVLYIHFSGVLDVYVIKYALFTFYEFIIDKFKTIYFSSKEFSKKYREKE